MGWAARAKESRGNPTPAADTRRIVSKADMDHGFNLCPDATHLTATFSDRTYSVDRNGTLRRMPPSEGQDR